MQKLLISPLAHVSLILVILTVLGLVRPTLAITHQEEHEMLAGKISETQQGLEDALAVLHSKNQDEWTPLEIQQYLNQAMWAVDLGIVQYVGDHLELPSTVESLSGTDYIPHWPDNPFNGFQPVKLLTNADGFQAGELVYFPCPVEHYSGIKNPRPRSFELAVYGPDTEFARLGDAEPMPGNDKWVVVPEGALYMTGMFTESGKHLKEKIQRRKPE